MTAKILSEKDRIEGEKKRVTVLFCDISGFTGIAEKLGPENVYGLMDQVYDILIQSVNAYQGTVNELTGDGIMAVFGAPVAIEDASHRALRSALAIHKQISRFNERMSIEKGYPPVRLRIGVHTGPVVVGSVGNDLRVEFKAVGDTVNLASRLETLAEPGTTCVTEDIFKLTEGMFQFENLGLKEIRGRTESIRVYRLLAPGSRRTRFELRAQRGLTPLVARSRELATLFDAFQRAKHGRGQAVSVVSEPGMGKSRLLYEFRKAMVHEDVTFLEGRCLSYSSNTPYQPVIDILKSNFDVSGADLFEEVKRKVRKGLDLLKEDGPLTFSAIVTLLTGHQETPDVSGPGQEEIRGRILDAMKRIVIKGSRLRPIIISVEDLHWIDQSSRDLLNSLVSGIAGFRVLFLFTFRHGFIPQWGRKSYHSQIVLRPLAPAEAGKMAAFLFGPAKSRSEVVDLILEKSEGNPFFIEEFSKSIQALPEKESGSREFSEFQKENELLAPSGIHEVIMARVDSLPEPARELIQKASAIEKEFGYGLIKEITGMSDGDLSDCIEALKEIELIYEREDFPERTFAFNHGLTREIVYESLLTVKKTALHNKIAKAVEKLYPHSLKDHYEQLSLHYVFGNEYERGAMYCRLAAAKAARSGAFNEAIFFTHRRIMCLEKISAKEDMPIELVRARRTLGLLYAANNYLIEAKQAVQPVVESAERLNAKDALGYIYTILGTYSYFVKEDFDTALKYLADAARIAEQLGDSAMLHPVYMWLGVAHAYLAAFDAALDYFQSAIRNADLRGTALAKGHIAWVYALKGDIASGLQVGAEAAEMIEANRADYFAAWVYTFLGWCHYSYGALGESRACLAKAITCGRPARLLSITSIAKWLLGSICFHEEKYEKSLKYLEEAVSMLEAAGVWPSWKDMFKITLARTRACSKGEGIDGSLAASCLQANSIKAVEGFKLRYLAETLTVMGKPHLGEAENFLLRAIEVDGQRKIVWSLAMDYGAMSALLAKRGDFEKALDCCAKAVGLFHECGSSGWAEKYGKEIQALAAISKERGRNEK